MTIDRWIPAFLVGVAIFVGAGWALQWRSSVALREQVKLLQADEHEVARLQAENDKLRAVQVSPEELQRLRADHDALVRLQAEIRTLQDSLRRREHALGKD